MFFARVVVVLFGIMMPYLARLPGIPEHGVDWLVSYFGEPVVFGVLFFGVFNMLCWGSILGATFLFRSASTVWFPAVAGFGFCFWCHSQLDLASDAQAGIGIVVFPVVALLPILIGTLAGWAYEKWRWRSNTLF
ncbi:MAG: hypothetical protein AAF086_05035 [Planctomycetota bacterium]